jgi:hypothetical protein
MDKSTLTSPDDCRPKRPRQGPDQFPKPGIAAATDVILIRLRHDDFVDIKSLPYPVKGLANGY